MKKTWNLDIVLQIVHKIAENYCPCLHLSISEFGDLMSYGSKDIFKNAACLMH